MVLCHSVWPLYWFSSRLCGMLALCHKHYVLCLHSDYTDTVLQTVLCILPVVPLDVCWQKCDNIATLTVTCMYGVYMYVYIYMYIYIYIYIYIYT